ncbi:MAG: YIP1 family protein [Lachnospiraceae bacterium]|nr:YIP1 family protein [Lachnospiraceae bacterium]
MSKAFSLEKWKYVFYTLSHPMDGYYWIRHADKGSVPIAIILVVLFSFSFTTNELLASFVVNDTDPRGVNSLYELAGVLALYLLICVGNWSVTCLMGGEGRLKDIAIAIGYATVPVTFGFIVSTIISAAVADDEQAFYGIILGVCIAYGLILMMIGIMQVHNYTLGKTLLTLILTFLAMLIIIFVLLLLSNLVGKVYNFIHSVYLELVFRT